MKKYFSVALSVFFVLGVLFPIKSTSDGKSSFIQDIKKAFHYEKAGSAKAEAPKKERVIKGEGGSKLFEEIGKVFHYFPEDKGAAKSKKYPKKFDDTLQKELKYPVEQK